MDYCRRGHPFTPENTIRAGVHASGNPKRRCRICYAASPHRQARRTGRRRGPGDQRERFLRLTEVTPTGCWEWQGSQRDGYGRTTFKGKHGFLAHRAVYETFVSEIPEGLQLDHLCRNTICVNPEHLEPVTCRENLLRGNTFQARNAAKTHCPQGHPYDDENTRLVRLTKGSFGRQCRACTRSRRRLSKAVA